MMHSLVFHHVSNVADDVLERMLLMLAVSRHVR